MAAVRIGQYLECPKINPCNTRASKSHRPTKEECGFACPNHVSSADRRRVTGQTVPIVEDEVMIAEYLAHELRENGATVLITLSHADALAKSDEPSLSIAVVDHKLHNRATADICGKPNERGVPFVMPRPAMSCG